MLERLTTFLLLLIVAGSFAAAEERTSVAATPESETVVFLVRHAEKELGGSQDPELTEAGETRAARLAAMLAPSGVTHLWSSDYRRCRDTAAPLAETTGLALELYDPRDLESLALRLRDTPGRHLVVGHSNTTPALAELLGGDGGDPIVEATEYDRLYVLVLGEATETVRMSF